MANTVATGAVLGMLGMDLDILIAIIKDTFKRRVSRLSIQISALRWQDMILPRRIVCSVLFLRQLPARH